MKDAMLKTEDLLTYVQRTNKNMTKDKLIEELAKSYSSASSLIREWMIHKEKNSDNDFHKEQAVGLSCRLIFRYLYKYAENI